MNRELPPHIAKLNELHQRIPVLLGRLRDALASANVLFQSPKDDAMATRSTVHPELLDTYIRALWAMTDELPDVPESCRRYYDIVHSAPDSIDYVNHLIAASGGRTFADLLGECIWDAIRHSLPHPDGPAADRARLAHALAHAARLFREGVSAPMDYLVLVEEQAKSVSETKLARINPAGLGAFDRPFEFEGCADRNAVTGEVIEAVRAGIQAHDVFAASRTFRPVRRELHPGLIGDIRSLDNFYGYVKERAFFENHFYEFLQGQRIPPLLLSGIPGVGKTHLTIAFTLSLPGVTLVNATADYLQEPLEWLVETLGSHHYRKFVVFFDDIDPDRVDWTTFRNQVEGYLPYAQNIAIVIASNSPFSARIRSRCAFFDFRPMSPEVCQEFVTEYLEEHRWMSQPYPNLVSTVAADYASLFKRGILSDLTPRSLIRYFEMLEGDKDKVRKLIRESLEEIVRVPSQDAFDISNRQIREHLEQERREHLGLPSVRESAPKPTSET